jgi:hypothetical protein
MNGDRKGDSYFHAPGAIVKALRLKVTVPSGRGA